MSRISETTFLFPGGYEILKNYLLLLCLKEASLTKTSRIYRVNETKEISFSSGMTYCDAFLRKLVLCWFFSLHMHFPCSKTYSIGFIGQEFSLGSSDAVLKSMDTAHHGNDQWKVVLYPTLTSRFFFPLAALSPSDKFISTGSFT